MFVGSAASITLVVARYAVGGGYPYAQAVVAFERDMFLRALATELLLCPFTILLLLLRLDRRPTEPPDKLVLIGAGTPPCSYMVQSTLEHVASVSALAMASYRC
ncbi:uncharacterized protein LOC101782174 [Setaria italica]|uniref:Uncharacterized protein n=1 Tax=Setaria italica TaxID=4555 RepID=K3XNI3_SETIT|nr:uncharacterized protein LOC101782174 [Setaria italica]